MKIEIVIKDLEEPHVVIYAKEITSEICEIVDYLKNENEVIVAADNEKTHILHKSEIVLIRVEGTATMIYCNQKRYVAKKRLCDLEKSLGTGFIRISKSTIINMKYISYVEPYFNGTMFVMMKDGTKDYISRKYLPDLKKKLGI